MRRPRAPRRPIPRPTAAKSPYPRRKRAPSVSDLPRSRAARAPRVPHTILVALLLAVPAAQSRARVPARSGVAGAVVSPKPVHPLDGERLPEGTARLEVAPGAAARDLRVVIARSPFEPSGWSSLPAGPGW